MPKPISKIFPATPSFLAWQRAADELLTLETMLARSRRVPDAPASPYPAAFRASLAQVRLIADQLFEVAMAEVNQARARRPATGP